jgi:hypothetical protein
VVLLLASPLETIKTAVGEAGDFILSVLTMFLKRVGDFIGKLMDSSCIFQVATCRCN